ncbi:MAG: VOC family protein [Pseudonocardiaceae bacterium]
MSTRTEPWPSGTPCWVDLAVPDVEAATKFYGAILGWTYSDTGEEFGHYQIGHRGADAAAGIGPQMSPDQPPAWTTYLASDDVDSTAEKITGNGGKVLAGPFDVPGSGRMCIALDSQGAAFGVWQATEHVGAEIYNEPGAMVWNQAAVPDPDAVRQFYAAVFGYSYQAVDGAGPDFTIFRHDGDPLGGIGGMGANPAQTPPHWITYFMVADADTAVETAAALGATVRSGPFDTPYGRMAEITDPQGASFAIMAALPSE